MESMKLFVPILVLGSSCVCAIGLLAADTAIVEEIVAKCNGDIVTRGDLDRSRRETHRDLARQRRSWRRTGKAISRTGEEPAARSHRSVDPGPEGQGPQHQCR